MVEPRTPTLGDLDAWLKTHGVARGISNVTKDGIYVLPHVRGDLTSALALVLTTYARTPDGRHIVNDDKAQTEVRVVTCPPWLFDA